LCRQNIEYFEAEKLSEFRGAQKLKVSDMLKNSMHAPEFIPEFLTTWNINN